MKAAPFDEGSDDIIAFVTEVQLAFTFFVGFALLTDSRETPFFNPDVMDILLVLVNCCGFATLIAGNCYQQECYRMDKYKKKFAAVMEMREQRKLAKLRPKEKKVTTIAELADFLENEGRDDEGDGGNTQTGDKPVVISM